MSTANHEQHEAYKHMKARGIAEKTERAEDYLAGWYDKEADADKWSAVYAGIKEKEISDLRKQLEAKDAEIERAIRLSLDKMPTCHRSKADRDAHVAAVLAQLKEHK